MALDATMKTALEGAAVTTCTLVSIAITGGATVRLSSGAAISYGGNTYSPEDSTYGILGDVDTIADGADGQATRCTIVLLPPTSSAISALAAATAQGSVVTVLQAAVNTSTGAVIGTPETLFTGELDFPKLAVSEQGYALTLECGTEESRLLEPNEERKLSDAFHQTCWSGELGLAFVTRVTRKIYWRATDPASAAIKPKRIFGKVIG